MSGVTVNLMKKTRLEYTYLAGGTSTTLIIRPSIKTGRFYYVELWVRVHEKNLATAGQTVAFSLYNTLPTREDPREFSESGAFLTLTMTNGTTAPALLSSGVVTNPGPYLKFAATISQPSGGGILYTQVSAAVNLREL
jgi:hypothetical protein